MPEVKVLTVSEPRRWEWPKDSGQFNEDYEIALEGYDKPAILTQKPTTAPPKPGEALDLEITPHPRFDGKLKAKRARAFTSGGGRSPEQTSAIQRQHSEHMAVLLLQVKATAGQLAGDDLTPAKIRSLTDWFDDDIAYGVERKHPSQKMARGLPVRNEPERTGTPDIPIEPYVEPAPSDGSEPWAA